MTIKKLANSDLTKLVNLHYEVLPNEFLTSISENFLLGFYQNLFSSPHTHFLGAFIPTASNEYKTGSAGQNIYSGWQERRESRRVPAASFPSEDIGRDELLTGPAAYQPQHANSHLIAAIVGLEEKYKPRIFPRLERGLVAGRSLAFKPKLNSYLLLILKNLPAFLKSPKSLISLIQSFFFKIGQPQETEIFFIGVKKRFQGQNIGKKLITHFEQILSSEYKTLSVDCKCKLPSNNFYKACGFKVKKTFRLYNEDWNRYEKKL